MSGIEGAQCQDFDEREIRLAVVDAGCTVHRSLTVLDASVE
jgi:hypothetical protein